jgi:hypothetical protein
MMFRGRRKSNSGASLAEAAAAMALFFPLIIAILYVVMEASQVYVITEALNQAARRAARNVATTYHTFPGIVASNANALALCCKPVCQPPGTVGAYVTDVSQFGGAGGAGTALTFTGMNSLDLKGNTTPATVEVTCTYISNGTTGLPQFPAWDVLNLSKVANFKLKGSAVYQVE